MAHDEIMAQYRRVDCNSDGNKGNGGVTSA